MTDAHAREARAERRWAARGRSLPARFLIWLARAYPWAWRVRLDLVALFNLALALTCVVLAQLVGPVLVANTDDYSSGLAALVLSIIAGLTALACITAWGYAVTKSPRLREQTRHGGAPGPILTCLVLLSFAFWAVAACAAPFVDLKRSPIYGDSVEIALRDRLTERREGMTMAEIFGEERFARTWGRTPPSERVCTRAGSSGGEGARDVFLCSLAATARRADLQDALMFDEHFVEWRAEAAHYSRAFGQGAAPREDWLLEPNPPALQEQVTLFATEIDPWRARIAAMHPWQRREDVFDDPAFPAAFARSHHFRRFLVELALYGSLDAYPNSLFENALDASQRAALPQHRTWAERWQETVRSRLLASPAFARAHAEAEQAFAGQGAPPAVLSTPAWTRIAETHTRMFASYQLTGNANAAAGAPPRGVAPDQWFAEWRAREADPAQRDAFIASDAYDDWRRAFLRALIAEGAFDADMRDLAPYRAVEDHWRRTIARPASAPEWRLHQEVTGNVGFVAVIGFFAAIVLAAFIVSVNHAGLAAAFSAFATNGVVALVGFIIGVTIVPAFAPVYDPDWAAASWSEIWFWGFGCATVVAPFVMAVLALFQRVRRRWTNFLAIFSIGACALWAPIGVFVLSMQAPSSFWQSSLIQVLAYLAATCLTVIGFAWLVSAMLTRIATFPRAR